MGVQSTKQSVGIIIYQKINQKRFRQEKTLDKIVSFVYDV